jgi:hypothetical protein
MLLLLSGDGLVVVVDAARFLPSSVTISRVLGSVWSSSGALLAGPFEGVAQPDSDALNPRYACSATLGVQHNKTRFEDATATLMLQVSQGRCIMFNSALADGVCASLVFVPELTQ